MQTKLTLRMESDLIEGAKKYAEENGKSVSQIVADYFVALQARRRPSQNRVPEDLPPITRSLYGLLAGTNLDEEDYRRHLEEKYR